MYFLAYVSDSMLTLVSCIPVFLSGRFHSGKLQPALSFHNSDMHEFQLSYFKDFSFVFSFHIFYHDVSSCGFLSCIIIPVLQQHALNLSYHDILTRSNCKKKKKYKLRYPPFSPQIIISDQPRDTFEHLSQLVTALLFFQFTPRQQSIQLCGPLVFQ